MSAAAVKIGSLRVKVFFLPMFSNIKHFKRIMYHTNQAWQIHHLDAQGKYLFGLGKKTNKKIHFACPKKDALFCLTQLKWINRQQRPSFACASVH